MKYLLPLFALLFLATSVNAATLLYPSGGGSGTSTPPVYGQVLVGNANGTYSLMATSSLGISGSSYTATYPVTLTGSAFGLAFGTTSSNTWAGTQTFTNAPTFTPLTSALVQTDSGGVSAEYSGTSCTNQFVRALSALGVATCATVANTDLANSTVSYGGVSLSLGGTDATPAFDLTDAINLPIVAGTTGTLSIARGGTGTTTAPAGQLLYGGPSSYQSIGTSTASCTTGVSCTSFTVVGSAAPSITATLGIAVDLASEVGATILPIGNGGLGAAFTDPNADRLMFWDDSAGFITGIATLTNLVISGTTLAIDLTSNFIWTGNHDFGGATGLEIPNGTAPTVDAVGEVAFDTTSGNAVIATSTNATSVVIGSATTTLYAFSIASTSPDLVSGGIIELPTHFLSQVATGIICKVDGGTSIVVNLSDGTNDTNAITCTTTETQYALTSNNTWTAYERTNAEMGTKTGSVDYLVLRVIGYRKTD